MRLQNLSGSELRLMRESKNLSINDLSARSGVSQQIIIAAEGEYPGVVESMDMITLKKWHNACNTSLIKRVSNAVRRYVKQKSKA